MQCRAAAGAESSPSPSKSPLLSASPKFLKKFSLPADLGSATRPDALGVACDPRIDRENAMPRQAFNDYVKLSKAAREELLEHLDEAAALPTTKRSRRTDQRFPFRRNHIPVLITQPGNVVGRFLVVTRNISTGGLSFVHGSFIHQGCRCQVSLPRISGQFVPLSGATVSCRHIGGMLHEVGVEFEHEIDVADFVSDRAGTPPAETAPIELPALTGHALLVAQRGSEDAALAIALHTAGMSVAPAHSAIDALGQIARIPPDVLLYDARLSPPSPAEAAEAFRKAGCAGLILAIDPNADRRSTPDAAFDLICLTNQPAPVLDALSVALSAPATPADQNRTT